MENIIEEILEKYPDAKRDSLLPILQDIQDKTGYISEEAVIKVGQHLKIPASKVYGVATFYNQFKFNKPGKYHIMVCRGTACHVLGSSTVLEELENILKIKAGETTKDGLFSIEVVACMGACGLAPVIAINGEFHAKVTPESLPEIVEEYRQKESEKEREKKEK